MIADIHGSIWNAYHSDVWPNRYLIDQEGDIVFRVEGEGNNRPMEEKIRALLVAAHPDVTQLPLDPPEDTFAASCGVCTDETYVGESTHPEWLVRFDLEHQNFRDALEFLIRTGDADWGMRLGSALFYFWETREHVAEGRALLDRLLKLPGAVQTQNARSPVVLCRDFRSCTGRFRLRPEIASGEPESLSRAARPPRSRGGAQCIRGDGP